ncbi:MAG TPA: ABC transporter substrate-binding protein [Thermoanaerobacterales bacterium]|nr:ABC transporter substrate-binding protein [Thermoanaerobacterales bacterium]
MKKIVVYILSFVLILGIVGCSRPAETVNDSDCGNEAVIQITDDEGKEITMEKPAQRIISLYSAHTENLFSLGLDEQIIGVGKSDNYPEQVKEKKAFDYKSDPENVIAEKPDLVLIRPFISKSVPDFVEALEGAGITVVSLYPNKFEDFDGYIMKLAKLTGKTEEAKAMLQSFHEEIQKINDMTKDIQPKVRVFFESTENECRTVTKDSMVAKAIELAGGVNIAEDAQPVSETSSIASYGVEKVLEKGKEIDVYVAQKGAMNARSSPEAISSRPGYSAIKAVKEGRVYVIDEKLVSSPTFRFKQGVEELAKMFYPDIFEN